MAQIEVQALCKQFGAGPGAIVAVDRVSFRVEPGEVVGLLGPNGAGKSTTMKMVTGFLSPTSGSAKVAGKDVQADPIGAKRALGYLPEGAPAYPEMTPSDFLSFVAHTRGLKGDERARAIGSAVERTQLSGVLHQRIETLSKGFKRRVGLAQAILHDPAVLIMDEPTDGLDPNQKHDVRALIRTMARSAPRDASAGGRAIVLSTHILEEVEAVCSRVIVIAKGKIVADETPGQLLARSGSHGAVVVTLHAPDGSKVRDALLGLSGVRGVEREGEGGGVGWTTWAIRPGAAHDGGLGVQVLRLCQSKGWDVKSLRTETGRMDEVFRDLTAGAQAKEAS